jgi:NAD(P)-dependent dehydrogenase (short-subunit alcohol dehydrogenase family)
LRSPKSSVATSPALPWVGAESDLDGALMLLASNASRYMTGSIVTMDGGFLLT